MAQINLYKTYDDFDNDTYTEYKDFKNKSAVFSSYKNLILIDNSGAEVTLPVADYWGFKYKDHLFRFSKYNNVPVCLISEGKLFYWENGIVHLDMLYRNLNKEEYYLGTGRYFLSQNLDSQLYVDHFLGTDMFIIQNFFIQYPEYASLLICLLDNDPKLLAEKEILPTVTKTKNNSTYLKIGAVSKHITDLEVDEMRACIKAFNAN